MAVWGLCGVCFPEEGSISLRFLSSGGPALSSNLRRKSGCRELSGSFHSDSRRQGIDMVCKEPGLCVGGCLGGSWLAH